ncbi:MAG: histidine kinase [Clostridia bacterium]|nr:histidine kinase [Clostridia bacterium]
MQKIKRILNRISDLLNDFSVRKKLMILYICCVLIPLIATDSVVMLILVQGEQSENNFEMANIASAVEYNLSFSLEEAVTMTNNIYKNRKINEFLERQYDSDLDFFLAGREFVNDSFYASSVGSSSLNIVMYTDNETFINGGHFCRLSDARKTPWYQKLQQSDHDMILYFYYTGYQDPSATSQKKISLIRKLNYYKDSTCEKIVKVDFDYGTLVRQLTNMKYRMPVYVCSNNRILYSNDGHSANTKNFEHLTGKEKIGYVSDQSVYGENIRILVMKPENSIMQQIWKHFPMILLMIAVNILLPWLLTYIINRSFTKRLAVIDSAFDQVEAESLKEIEYVQGKDEIGNLMQNYNRMVRRSQELIKTVYKDRLERQEMDIARQKAELMALHSQINPHFLFNVLEGIRMHSILKKEDETAGMIERLAILERQNVNWSADDIPIKEELHFIGAYLDLQKYRFGDRLSYEISVESDCYDYTIPKLTLVTFVENACVHGIEKKSAHCWIYVRIYRKNNYLCLEIEDTGNGISEEEVVRLNEKMRECSIKTLMENEHVGIINACLRLKMTTKGNAEFELESEEEIGTFMLIKIAETALQIKKPEE